MTTARAKDLLAMALVGAALLALPLALVALGAATLAGFLTS